MFRTYLFTHFSRSYDIIVNFIDAHEEATKNILNVIENKHFVDKILKESQINTEGAETYMLVHIEDMFPEIAKAIQMRRA
jgi:ABC-type transport system involved in cytochrome c biogenesis ATPase subunit